MSDSNGFSEADRLVLLGGGAIAATVAWLKRGDLWPWLVEIAQAAGVIRPSAGLPLPGAAGAGLDAARIAIVLGLTLAGPAIAWRLRRRRNPVVPKVTPPS